MNKEKAKIEVQTFHNIFDKNPKASDWMAVYDMVLHDKSLELVTTCVRDYDASGEEDRAQKLKAEKMPCISIPVIYNGGKKKDNIARYTGDVVLDFDEIPASRLDETMSIIIKDPHTKFCSYSIRKHGFHVVAGFNGITGDLKHDEQLYLQAWLQIGEYYERLIGSKKDEQCKNTNRVCGLAHDPSAYLNLEAQAFDIAFVPKKAGRPKKKQTGKYHADIQDAAKLALKEVEDKGIRYAEGSYNEYVMRCGYILNELGINREEAMEWAIGHFSDYASDKVRNIFDSCYSKTEDYGTRPIKKEENNGRSALMLDIIEYLSARYRFRFNKFTCMTEVCKLGEDSFFPMDDRIFNTIYVNMSKELGRHVRKDDVQSLIQSDFSEDYNPLLTYLDGLTPWKEEDTDYISLVASTVHCQEREERFEYFFRKWIVGVIGNVLNDDFRKANQQILALIGPQGTYKSSFLNHLLPDCLQAYLDEKSDNSQITKDDKIKFFSVLITILNEVDTMSRKELNNLKAVVGSGMTNERIPYDRFAKKRKRLTSFCATGNNIKFLTDQVNRRWWVFLIKSIDSPFDNPLPVDGMWAQAYYLYKHGFKYWADNDDNEEIREANHTFEVADVVEERICKFYHVPTGAPGEDVKVLTTSDILEKCDGGHTFKVSPSLIGQALGRLGVEKRRTNSGYRYLLVEYTGEEIAARDKLDFYKEDSTDVVVDENDASGDDPLLPF